MFLTNKHFRTSFIVFMLVLAIAQSESELGKRWQALVESQSSLASSPHRLLKEKTSAFNKAFQKVYTSKQWGDGQIPLSGEGSDACIFLQSTILDQHVVDLPDVETIVQIGFGDFEQHQHLILEGKKYKGYDVAQYVLRPSKFNYDFEIIGDIDQIKDYGDLLLIKDVLQHWPNQTIERFTRNIMPRFKYILIQGSYRYKGGRRPNIKPGHFKQINESQFPNYCKKFMKIGQKMSFFCVNPNWLKDI